MNTTTQWQIPFFVNVAEEQFSQEIRALGFICNAQGDFLWQGGTAAISLKPLRTNAGSHKSGYRFYYDGDRLNDCLAVLNLILSMYQGSSVTGVECCVKGSDQETMIQKAEKKKYTRGSMYGLYQNGRVGVVCMPQNTVLQVRKKGIRTNQLDQILSEIAETKEALIGQVFNLFTAMSSAEGELMLA